MRYMIKKFLLLTLGLLIAACNPLSESEGDATQELLGTTSYSTAQAVATQVPTLLAMQATADQAVIIATNVGQLNQQNLNLQSTVSSVGAVINAEQQLQQQNQQQSQPGQPPVQQSVPQTLNDQQNVGAQPPKQDTQPQQPAASRNQPTPIPPPPSINNSSSSSVGGSTAIAPPPGANIQPTAIQQAQVAENPAVTPLPLGDTTRSNDLTTSANGTGFQRTTTATGVRDDDGCAIDSVAVFQATQPEIYLVTEASNVPQGVTYTVNWLLNGEQQFSSSAWTTQERYDTICIWFFATPPFEAGNWQAALTENGIVVTSADFTIVGE